MSAVEEHPPKVMPFALRPLTESDVAQSAEIERDAFPSLFPPTSFRRELQNRLASYLVAWMHDDGGAAPAGDTGPGRRGAGGKVSRFGRWLGNGIWSKRDAAWQPGQQFLTGFLGTWYMADEAHIVSVGVRSRYRGRGIGELLLIGAIEQAMMRRARVVTLEVRVSNHVAQNLYRKHGFTERGVRKGYYTDNREDALIMATEPILVPPYPERFKELVSNHERQCGRSERTLA